MQHSLQTWIILSRVVEPHCGFTGIFTSIRIIRSVAHVSSRIHVVIQPNHTLASTRRWLSRSDSHPVGRAVQAAACKAAEAGAIPARDSNSFPMYCRTHAGGRSRGGLQCAIPGWSCANTSTTFATRMPVRVRTSQAWPGAVRLRLRVAFLATHQFCIRGEIIIILRYERRVCRWESCRMHQFHFRIAS